MLSPKQVTRRIDAALARQGDLGQALIKAVVSSAGIKLAYTGIGFVNAILLAKLLGPDGFGTYAYALALVTFVSIPSQFGIPTLATREIAVANARKDWAYMRGFIRWAHRSIALFSSVLIALGLSALLLWRDAIATPRLHAIALGLILVPFLSLGALRAGMLRGLRKVILGLLPERIIKPLVILVLLLLLHTFARHLASATVAMGIQIVAATTAFACGLFLFFKNRPADLRHAQASAADSRWLKSSIPLGLSAGLQLINGQTDILVLGMFRPDAEVGIYRVAVQMAAVVIFGLQVVNVIQGPHIAHLYAMGDMRRVQKMVTRSAQAILGVTLPAVLVIVVFGETIIRTAFGDKYQAAYLPLVILCVGQLVNAAMGSVGSLLNMTGHERDATMGFFVGAVVNVLLNFSLVPLWGMTGAAVATAATLIVWNLIMWRQVYVRTGIEASGLFRRPR